MPTKALRVLTYNVKMLPGPFGDGPNGIQRADKIVRTILATQPAWDIVCLQEVFAEDVRALLVERLRGNYPFQISKSDDRDIFHEDSGLFFASRFPIIGSRFVEFEASAGNDRWADKGILGARLNVEDTTVLVFNTHMQSSVKHGAVRMRQANQIRRYVRHALEALRPEAIARVVVVACGDFNVVGEHVAPENAGRGPSTDEYLAFIGRLGWPRDLFREKQPQDAGFTWDGSLNATIPADDKDRQRLDYVFAWDAIPAKHDDERPAPLAPVAVDGILVERFETTPRACLSDHFALSAKLLFDA